MQSVDDWEESGRRPSTAERLYDGLALLLLIWPATAGMGLLGSTRVWGYAPGLFFSLLGSLLVLARPLVFRRTSRWHMPPGFWIWAVLTMYVVLRVPWAAVPYAARWEALRWVCLLAAAFAWTQMGGREHRWKWLLGILLLAVTLDSLYALVQEMNHSIRVLWTDRPEQYGLRASGTYLCPNHFANIIAMLVPLAMVMLFLPEAGFPLRLMSLYFLVISAPVLYWTQSRSGWLGMTGGVGITLLLLAWRKGRKRFLMAMLVLPLLAAALGSAAWMALPAVRERFGQVLADPDKASGIRIQMWRDAPAMFRDRPVFGFGGGSYVWAYPPYQRHVKQHLNWDYAHNEYIQMLLEYGAVGLALVLAGLLATGWGLLRAVGRARSREGAMLLAGAGGALGGSLIHAMFDFNFHIFPNPHALVWMGGVAWGVWVSHEQGSAPSQGHGRPFRWAASALGAGMCGFCAWLALSGGISYVWNLKAEIARTRMDPAEAEAKYAKAIRWDGENWQPHLGLGNLKSVQALWYRDPDLVAEREGRIQLASQAAGHFQDALRRNPADMSAVFGLARAHNAMGDPEGALEYFRRAVTHQRRHTFYREQLGIQLRRMGRYDEALEVFRKNREDGVATEISTLNILSMERQRANDAPPPSP